MNNSVKNIIDPGNGFGLILVGLALSLLGAASVALMVIGLSYVYVGYYQRAVLLLAGYVFCGGIFLKTYGPYLQRLENHAPWKKPAERQPVTTADNDGTDAQPLPANVIIALATAAYGLIIVSGGIIWTRGEDLVLNLIAGSSLLGIAAIVWIAGGRRD
ncbi:MAG: hypothetical protein JXM70_07905 [Pirellulales bacterium]|nr:hypothetical protein [Pirellulales bacterium]